MLFLRFYTGSGFFKSISIPFLKQTLQEIATQIKTGYLLLIIFLPFRINIRKYKGASHVNLRAIIENHLSDQKKLEMRTIILDRNGREVSRDERPVVLEPGSGSEFQTTIIVNDPELWSVESPEMYTLISEIGDGKKVLDRVSTPFGIRSIEYDADRGFLLNGVQVKMNGVCLHHDGGAVGAAVPVRVWERRLEILREMGCNAIRTAHNPIAPEFMDLCDQMGFLVMNEAFDEWKGGK